MIIMIQVVLVALALAFRKKGHADADLDSAQVNVVGSWASVGATSSDGCIETVHVLECPVRTEGCHFLEHIEASNYVAD